VFVPVTETCLESFGNGGLKRFKNTTGGKSARWQLAARGAGAEPGHRPLPSPRGRAAEHGEALRGSGQLRVPAELRQEPRLQGGVWELTRKGMCMTV